MQDLNLALFISEDELFAAISKYAANLTLQYSLFVS